MKLCVKITILILIFTISTTFMGLVKGVCQSDKYIQESVNSADKIISHVQSSDINLNETSTYEALKKELCKQDNPQGLNLMGYSNGKIYNEYVEFIVGNNNGRFTIGTTGGDPAKTTDDNMTLLCGHPNPSTSYSTIRLDGSDYRYNPTTQYPTVDETRLSNTSQQNIGNVNIKQELRIIKNSSTNHEDIVEIKYTVTNKDSIKHDVGVRILMDTMLGSNDSAPFRIPGIGAVTKELELTGSSIPQYWQAFDNLNSPSIIAQGTLLNSQYLKPDRVQFARWGASYSSLWNYIPNTSLDIGDSAVSIYWDPKMISPNGYVEFVTYYGLSSLSQVSNGIFVLNLTGDSNIEFTKNGYNPNPFTVTAYIRNNGNASIANTKVKINLPSGLVLSSGQQQEINLSALLAGQEKQISWKVNVISGVASGALSYQVTVIGDNAASVTANRGVSIAPMLTPPTINTIGNKTIDEGKLLQFTVSGSDSDGCVLTYSAIGLPTGAIFDSATRTFKWTPTYTQSGSYTVKFSVSDGVFTTSEDVVITVNNVNRQPALNSIESKTVDEGKLLQFTVFGSDPDGDALTYTATGLPIGAAFDSATQTFRWTPTYAQSGSYTVKFSVSDGVFITSEDVVITINNVNRQPILNPIEIKTIDEGKQLQFTVSGSDPDGDALTYTATGLPIGAVFDSATQTFRWTPTYAQSGSYTVKFSVSDGIFTTSEDVVITVNNVNRQPMLNPIESKIIDEGKLLQFTVSGSDPDGDALTYTATGLLPIGALFDSATQTFKWTPTYTQSGSYTVKFTVSDANSIVSGDVLITVNNIEVWLTKENMPTARSSAATVAVNGSIYVIGGINGSGSLNIIEQYSPSSITWDAKASMPTARHGAGAAVVDGRIYVIGGKSGSRVVKVVEEYNPTLDIWTTKSDMPTGRFGLSVVAVNGKIYAIGGYTGSNYLNTVEVYDPATDTWTTKASMYTKRANLGADVLNGKIYAVGGYNGTYQNTVEEYDPLIDTWTTKGNMLTPRRGIGAAAVNGKLFVTGGYNGSDLNILEEYDTVADRWTVKKNMPTARGWVGTAAVNDIIYVVGGSCMKEGYLNVLEMYIP